jgi:hypothetical protein
MNRGIKLAALILLAGLLAFTAWNMREFGEPSGDPDTGNNSDITLYNARTNSSVDLGRTDMDDFYLDNTQEGESDDEDDVENGASTNNAVTAVVFDYRGFDTIGEATVLFAAVSGVLIALRSALPPKKKGGDS